ncbi:hypothetical protein TcG_02067 [Trypanosoma cruzi]|nr:hypothetical protein TcG_02067 [Trypanosoma cruzi]
MAVYFRHPRACVGRGPSCGSLRNVRASRRHGTPAFREQTARHRSVGFTYQAVVRRLHQLLLKLNASILHVNDGVVRLRSLHFRDGQPSLWTGGIETQNLVLGAPGDPQCAP